MPDVFRWLGRRPSPMTDEQMAAHARSLGMPVLAEMIEGTVVKIRKADLDEMMQTILTLRAQVERFGGEPDA